jgi:hypothetical protein
MDVTPNHANADNRWPAYGLALFYETDSCWLSPAVSYSR